APTSGRTLAAHHVHWPQAKRFTGACAWAITLAIGARERPAARLNDMKRWRKSHLAGKHTAGNSLAVSLARPGLPRRSSERPFALSLSGRGEPCRTQLPLGTIRQECDNGLAA